MAKPDKIAADLPPEAEEPVEDAAPGATIDPDEFLSQIEARAHKGAESGFAAAMESWLKDTDLEVPVVAPPTRGGSGGPVGAGGESGGPGTKPPTLVQEALELAFGRPRKRT